LKDKINSLIQLQDCDNKIREVTAKKKQGPLKIKELETTLNEQEEKYQEIDNRLETLARERRKIEQDILELDNKIEKSNIKLNNIKSNKEYRSALKEIDDLNREKSLMEDKLIQNMEEAEDLEAIATQNHDKQRELKKTFQHEKDAIDKELKELDKTSEFLEKQREAFYKLVDQDLLKTYLFLSEKKEGQAISAVVGGVCQTCHMGIPPQQFNELKKCLVLLNCPNCNRMIYWGEDESFQK
jgi:predicted  nucleic acid-binding Zn-ribbon protein